MHRTHTSHTSKTPATEHATASARKSKGGGGNMTSSRKTRRASFVFFMSRATFFNSFLHLMNAFKKPLRKNHFRICNSHHIVTRMTTSRFAVSTEIKVITNNTLVSVSINWSLLARIASNSMVDQIFFFSSFLWVISTIPVFFFILDNNLKLVHRARHFSKGNDQLFIHANGNIITIFIGPADRKDLLLELRKNCTEFLLQVGEAGANIFINNESSDFFCIILVFQENFI